MPHCDKEEGGGEGKVGEGEEEEEDGQEEEGEGEGEGEEDEQDYTIFRTKQNSIVFTRIVAKICVYSSLMVAFLQCDCYVSYMRYTCCKESHRKFHVKAPSTKNTHYQIHIFL